MKVMPRPAMPIKLVMICVSLKFMFLVVSGLVPIAGR